MKKKKQLTIVSLIQTQANIEEESDGFQYNDPATWPPIDERVRNQVRRCFATLLDYAK